MNKFRSLILDMPMTKTSHQSSKIQKCRIMIILWDRGVSSVVCRYLQISKLRFVGVRSFVSLKLFCRNITLHNVCAVHRRTFSTLRYIMHEYSGGYHEYTWGYHQYRLTTMSVGDIMSTLGDVQYTKGIP